MNDTKKLLETALEAAKEVRKEAEPKWWQRLFVSTPKPVKPDLCESGQHDYGKWEFLRNIKVFDNEVDKIPVRIERSYIRHCRRCGAPQSKRITA